KPVTTHRSSSDEGVTMDQPAHDVRSNPPEVEARPPLVRTILLGAQHLLAMYASIAATPLALAVALDVPQEQVVYLLGVTALMSGVATIIQSVGIWKIG